MNSILSTLFLFVLIFFGIACGSSEEKSDGQIDTKTSQTALFTIPDTLKPGILYEKLAINHDELNTFSLYLPKLYHTNFLWPIVFFFDPGGNGSLPLKHYQTLADSLGYILIGSNVSKNGQDMDETMTMWNALKNSCVNNLSINKNSIVLAGFSGGARVCCAIASKEPNIACIIANSAGAQQLDQLLNQHTLFIGMAGNGDMNRAEMLSLEQYLSGTSLIHYYIEFDGIHEWAPSKIMQKALMIASLNAYQKNPGEINTALVERFIANQKKDIEKLKIEGHWVEVYQELVILKKGAMGINTLADEDMDSLYNDPKYIAAKNELLKLTSKETEIQQELYKLMLENPDQTIWKNKIAQIRKNSLQKNKIGQMNQRLLGYASLVSYSLSNRNLVAKNYPLAELMVSLYEIADPENPEVYFFKAIIYGAKSDSATTCLNLNKSIKLGLNDKKRIINQSEFNFLKDHPKFKEILNKIQF